MDIQNLKRSYVSPSSQMIELILEDAILTGSQVGIGENEEVRFEEWD